MDTTTVNRYQPGGDIYAKLLAQYGQGNADAIAQAARSGDESQVNAAIVNAKYGPALDTSTLDAFGNQLATDPLGAPLAGLNNIVGNTVFSFLQSPWVLGAVALGLFFFFGGADYLRRKLANLK